MRAAVAALLVGCVVLACAAPSHASRSDADEEAGYPIQPAGMDLARIQSFVQSLVTGEAAKPVSFGCVCGGARAHTHLPARSLACCMQPCAHMT